jgi:general secretion pathway protein L
MLESLFAQWVDGLATAILWLDARARPADRYRLRSNSKSIDLFHLSNSLEVPVFSADAHELEKSLPAKLLQQTRNSTIEIVVPAAAIIERRLDPLPAESLPFIDNVVLHQIETILPWRASDILHSTRAERRSDGMLDISVQATPRSAVRAELAMAKALTAGEVLITTANHDQDGHAHGQIIASIGSYKENKLTRARSISRIAIVAALISSVGIVGWTTYMRWSLSSDIAALDQAIADRRALIKRGVEANASSQSRGLEARKQLTPAAVIVIDTLSSILPDGTYLTDLTLDAGRVRITGISSNAVDLVPLLEKSGQFKNASFYAPTTRLGEGISDRFSIEATLAPQGSVTP